MLKKILLLLSLALISFFVFGCDAQTQTPAQTQQPGQIPQTVVNTQQETNLTPVVIPVVKKINAYKIPAGKENVYAILYNGTLNIVNCGNSVYAPVVAEKLQDLKGTAAVNYLVLTNYSSDYIGGCTQILAAFNNVIKEVRLYQSTTQVRDEVVLNDVRAWMSPGTERIMSGEWQLQYDNIIVNQSNIDSFI